MGSSKAYFIKTIRAFTDTAIPYLSYKEKLVCVSLLETYVESNVWKASFVVTVQFFLWLFAYARGFCDLEFSETISRFMIDFFGGCILLC